MRTRMVVDFPAPFGPSRPNSSPLRMSRSSPSTAANDPYSTRSPERRIIIPNHRDTEAQRRQGENRILFLACLLCASVSLWLVRFDFARPGAGDVEVLRV